MDDAELHLRLSACRPHGQDNDDPLLKEAMEKLPHRPGMMEWFTEEQAFDRKLCKCMGDVPVPENLKSEILASAKLNSAVPRWQRLPWLAAAAAIALTGLAFTIYQPIQAEPTLAEFETEIVDIFDSMKNNGYGIEHVTREFANVSAWLATQGAPKPYTVKSCTSEARPFGCRTVNWRGQKVAMVCFGRGDQGALLFVVPKESLKDSPDPVDADPEKVQHVDGYPVASWACRKYVYVMMGDSPETRLDAFLVAQSDIK